MSDDTVGSYVLIEKLGEGGMGEVYLARHKYIARRAAIKFLLRELSGSSDLVGRFFAEARAASVIKHPGIVEVLDCDVHEDGRAYIVMELLRGESLRDYLGRVEGAGRDEAGLLAIFRQIASALAAAHAQEIVHRDLKPDNIYLHVPENHPPFEPIVKVLDFGIAKLMGRGGEGGTKTRTGQLLGTPMYMSPEQCRGLKQIDLRSDIYSLGCIMYEVFCGRPPFIEEGFGDLIIAHVSLPPQEPSHFAPGMSAAARQILLGCLAKDPRARPQTMDEIIRQLAEAGAPEVIDLEFPVLVVPGADQAGLPSKAASSSPDERTRSPPRLAQTTPMSAAAAASSRSAPAGADVAHPSFRTPGGAAPTPASAGRTRVLERMRTDPNTLHEGASETFPATVRTRSRGGKVAVAIAAVAAAGLTALVIVRVLTPDGLPLPSQGATAGSSTSLGNEPGTPGTPESAEPEPRPAKPPATPPPIQPVATSVIELSGLPPEATVRLDGRLVTPPLSVPRLRETHRLVIDAAGYQRAEMSFDGTADRSVAVDMKRLAGPAPAPRRPVAGKSHKKSERPNNHEEPGFKAFTDL